MAGTKAGAAKAKQTRIAKLGSEEAYRVDQGKNGRKGGEVRVSKGRWKKTKFDEGNGLEIKKPPLLKRLGKTINVRG